MSRKASGPMLWLCSLAPVPLHSRCGTPEQCLTSCICAPGAHAMLVSGPLTPTGLPDRLVVGWLHKPGLRLVHPCACYDQTSAECA